MVAVLLLFMVIVTGVSVYFKFNPQKLNKLIVEQLQKHIHANISLEHSSISVWSHFPNVSINLSNLQITDSLLSTHKRPLLKVGQLSTRVPIKSLLRKAPILQQLTLNHATMHLFTDSTGYSNKYILDSSNPATGNQSKTHNSIREIIFLNSELIVEDLQKNKQHHIAIHRLDVMPEQSADQTILHTRLDAMVKQLSFNTHKGAFLRNTQVAGNFPLRINKSVLQFDSIMLQLNRHPFLLWGNFELGPPASSNFNLKVDVKNILFDSALKLLTPSIVQKLDMVHVNNELDAVAHLSGKLAQPNPLINLEWENKNARINTAAILLDSASLKGQFTNQYQGKVAPGDENSRIHIQQLQAYWRGIPFLIPQVSISNLAMPILQTRVNTTIQLRQLTDVIPVDKATFTAGTALLNIGYNGPINKGTDFIKYLTGNCIINNAALGHGLSSAMITDLNARINIQNAGFHISSLQLNTDKRKVNITGYITPTISTMQEAGVEKSRLSGIKLSDAHVQIFTHGHKPAMAKQSMMPASKTQKGNFLRSIALQNVTLLIMDKPHFKRHEGTIHQLQLFPTYHTNDIEWNGPADISIRQMSFNTQKGAYLSGAKIKGRLHLIQKKDQLVFEKNAFTINGLPLLFNARFDLKKYNPQFWVQFYIRNLQFADAKQLITKALAQKIGIVNLNGQLHVDARISGPLSGGAEKILVNAAAQNASLATPFFDFTHTDFRARFNNEFVKGAGLTDENSAIVFDTLSARWNQMPVHFSQLQIVNLNTPLLHTTLQSDVPLSLLNSQLKSKTLQLQDGTAHIHLRYEGPIERTELTNAFVDASIEINNGKIFYIPRAVPMNNVQGRLKFNNTDLFVENLQCDVLRTKVYMSGVGHRFLTLINTDPNNAIINWNIFSPEVDLANFLFLLQKKSAPSTAVADSTTQAKTLQDVANKIDSLLDKGALKVALRTNKLKYNQFSADSLFTDVTLLQDKYIIHEASMQHAGGKASLSGSVTQQENGINDARFSAAFSNVDVASVFTAFNNFGQTGLLASNIEGRLTAALNAAMHITDSSRLIPSSVKSQIYFYLKDGALKNFEPIKKIKKFVLKKRDFNRIAFAELTDSLLVSNQQIIIPRMEIQSTVLSMFVEGVYDIKGKTDISVQLPLSNLKRRGPGFILQNMGITARAGRSVYLRGRPGKDGNIKFKLDLRKRYFKDKKKAAQVLSKPAA